MIARNESGASTEDTTTPVMAATGPTPNAVSGEPPLPATAVESETAAGPTLSLMIPLEAGGSPAPKAAGDVAGSPETPAPAAKDHAFEAIDTLSIPDKNQMMLELHQCERIIHQARKAWQAEPTALIRIRDGRLHRARGISDLGRYCKEWLGMGKSTLNRKIAIGEVYHAVASTGAKILPTSERMMRPLLSLKADKKDATVWAEAVASVWAKAVHDAGITKKPLTQKSVVLARHQLGLDPKPKDSQPALDLENRWKRVEAYLEHEREF